MGATLPGRSGGSGGGGVGECRGQAWLARCTICEVVGTKHSPTIFSELGAEYAVGCGSGRGVPRVKLLCHRKFVQVLNQLVARGQEGFLGGRIVVLPPCSRTTLSNRQNTPGAAPALP